MSSASDQQLEARIEEAINAPAKRSSLYTCMKRGRDTRADALAARPTGDAFRDDVKRTKQRCIAEQDALLDRFKANAEKRGAQVFLAKDAAAAIEYVLGVVLARGAKTVSKSKSLTTEEIEINRPLEKAGLRVVETDLGELIIQLVDEKPYHLVFPSVHKTAVDVAKIFEKELGEPVPDDIDELMKVVRRYLRPIFLNTDVGMTGANIGIAETGGIVIETNEGNARLVSSIGDCHICVMGVEKIVETVEDALLMVMAHPLSATGQCPTTYVTWMAGRSPLGEGGATPRESHIVILDNGRAAMREDPQLREALHCIRCGACMNICPTYGVVGGHTFGYIYPGPIGIPWTAQTHGLDKAAAFAPLCISCGLCKEICPADIDMPMMIAEVKQRGARAGHRRPSRAERTMMAAERFAALGSATAPLSNRIMKNGLARRLMETFLGVDRRRELPPFAHTPFLKAASKRPRTTGADAKLKVAFFADVYANFNRPDLAESATNILEAAGCTVAMPPQKGAGYPHIAYGDLDEAAKVARYNVAQLAPLVRAGHTVVSLEPTAVYALRHAYPKLLAESEDARIVSENAAEFFEYLIEHAIGAPEQRLEGRRIGFHCSCHQRPLGSGRGAMQWLRAQGAECVLVETGTCCGMGGTFGLKTGALGYDLAQAVGEQLFEAFARAGVDAIVTESSVCKIQLEAGTGLPVYHPLDLLGRNSTKT